MCLLRALERCYGLAPVEYWDLWKADYSEHLRNIEHIKDMFDLPALRSIFHEKNKTPNDAMIRFLIQEAKIDHIRSGLVMVSLQLINRILRQEQNTVVGRK